MYVSETLHINPLSFEIIGYIATCPKWSEKEGPVLMEAPSQPPLPWSPWQRRNCILILKTPTPRASHAASTCVPLTNEVTWPYLASKEGGRKINAVFINSPCGSHNKICLEGFLRGPLKCCIRMVATTHKRKYHGNLNNKSLNNQGNFLTHTFWNLEAGLLQVRLDPVTQRCRGLISLPLLLIFWDISFVLNLAPLSTP